MHLQNPHYENSGQLEDINKDLLSKYENVCSVQLSLKENDKALDYAYKAINIIETTDSLKPDTKSSHLEKLQTIVKHLKMLQNPYDSHETTPWSQNNSHTASKSIEMQQKVVEEANKTPEFEQVASV